MKKLLSIVALITIALLPLTAEESGVSYSDLKLSMEGNNAELRQAEEAIVQSNLDVKDAKAAYQPEIELTLTGTYMANPPIGKMTLSTDEILSQLGVASLPGIASSGYFTLYDGMENTFYNAGLSLTQPIFTWGKIPKSVKLYQNIADISVLQKQDKEDQLNVELLTRLTALKYMDQVLAILDETQTLADELVKASEDGYENGMLLKQDVAEAKLSAMEIKVNKQEIEKEYSSVLQGVRTITAKSDLLSSDIDFTPDEEFISSIIEMDSAELRSAATDPSASPLKMLKKQTAAYELKKSIANRSMYWNPDLALQITANYGGSRFPGEINWSAKDDWGLYVTVALKTTIWDGGKKINEQKRSQSQITDSYADYDSAVEQLASKAEENISSMELAVAKIEYLTLKQQSAEDRLELVKVQNEVGTVANTDVLQQEIEVNKLKMEIIQQKITLAEAAYTLKYLARL